MSARDQASAGLPSEAWNQLERLLEQFEDAWQRGERPDLDDFLAATSGAERRALLIELVHEDLDYRLKAGEPVRVEGYLDRYPELASDRAVLLDLIAREFSLRRRA